MDEPIYITGAGIISAIGNDKQEVLCSLQNKCSGIGTMRYLQSEHTELPVGEVKLSDDQMRKNYHWVVIFRPIVLLSWGLLP